MKILIVAYYFPPQKKTATIASLRPYSWAKYWSQLGHEICVLTTPKNQESKELTELDQVRIEEAKNWLSKKKTANIVDLPEQSSLYPTLRQLSVKTRKVIGSGSLLLTSDFWIVPAVKKALSLYQEWKFDVVVSTYGPPASHIVAGIIQRKLNLFWTADYRDLWHRNHFVETKGIFSLIEESLENYFVSTADLITTVSQPLCKTLSSRFHKKAICIENGFDVVDLHKIKKDYFQKDNKVKLAYTGTIYTHKQDPSPLFQAVQEFKKQEISVQDKLEILFYGWDLGNLADLVERYQVDDVVKIKGGVNREQALEIQQSVNALIFLDWNNPAVDGILTGKLFEYMYSGKPILGIGAASETSAGRLIEEAGVGVSLGRSVEKIADCLEKLLNGENLSYSPNLDVLQRYTRENLAIKMLESILKEINEQ